jgi:hypothetical protein
MDKWNELRLLMKADISHVVHYSNDKYYEHGVTKRYLEMMDALDEKEKRSEAPFLFTDIPEFDKSTWQRMMNELQGLS